MKLILKHLLMWPLGVLAIALSPLLLLFLAFYVVGAFVYEDVLGFDL